MQRSKNCAQELSENVSCRVANSKCMLTPTNLKITVVISQAFSQGHAMQIQESVKGGYSTYTSRGSGGMLQKVRDFCAMRELLVQSGGYDARPETIKWPFLDEV